VVLVIALTVMSLFVAAGLGWAGRRLHISNLDAQALAEKIAFPAPASAFEWPELRVQSAVPQPDDLSPVIMQVGWPAHPELVATLLVALDDHDEQRAVSVLCRWSASRAGIAALRRGAELELRRRQSLERVHAILLAEDYQDGGDRFEADWLWRGTARVLLGNEGAAGSSVRFAAVTMTAENPVQAIVRVRLAPRLQQQAFEGWLRAIPAVRYAVLVTGDADYELLLGCHSFADLGDVLTQICGCPDVQVASTALVLHEVAGLGRRKCRSGRAIPDELTVRRLSAM
jgi:Lrp/AsnC ligand binding domain